MKTKIVQFTTLVLVLAGSFSSCENRSNFSDTQGHATGTIIGSFFYGGIGSLLVQVDEKYPIGKTIKYEYARYGCMQLPKAGTYRNMIQVQPYPHLPLSDFPETEVLNKRISFSYREYQRPEEGEDLGDYLLFIATELFPVRGECTMPDVPKHIITDCQIIK